MTPPSIDVDAVPAPGGTPAGGAFRSVAIDLLLPVGVFACYVLLLAGYWIDPTRVVVHDTFAGYIYFHRAYSHLVLSDHLLQWLPYSVYGVTTHMSDLALMPPHYRVAMLAGAAAGVTNAWLLFLTALFAQAGLFGTGVYLLARQFAGRAAAAMVMGAMLWTLVIDYNVLIVLRPVTLAPLVLVFLVRWARRGDLLDATLAVSAAVLACWSNGYFSILLAYWFGLAGLVLLVTFRPRPSVRRPVALTATACLTLTAIGLTLYAFVPAIADIQFASRSRAVDTFTVGREAFMTYGGGGILKGLESFIASPIESVSTPFYAGSLTVVFACYAVWRARSRELLAWLLIFATLLVFCWGHYSFVAWAAYSLPGMSLFRHTGLMYAVPKLLLAPLVAIGLHHFVRALAGESAARARRSLQWCALLATLVSLLVMAWHFSAETWTLREPHDRAQLQVPALLLSASVVVGFAVIALLARYADRRWTMAGLCALMLAQGAVYQQFYARLFSQPVILPPELREVHAFPFEARRTRDVTVHPRAASFALVANRVPPTQEVGDFLHIDSCMPITRVDFVTRGVDELIRRQYGAGVIALDLKPLDTLTDPQNAFLPVVGCRGAKLQWIAQGDAQALTAFAPWPSTCVDRALCLERDGDRLVLPWPTGTPPERTLEEQGIAVHAFEGDRLSLTLTADRHGWLVYADAITPAWHVEVDGVERPLWRANFAFKAVELPAGHHTVRFVFRDELYAFVYWTMGIGGTAAVGGLMIAGFAGLQGRRFDTMAGGGSDRV
jgi:hypothetical protein